MLTRASENRCPGKMPERMSKHMHTRQNATKVPGRVRDWMPGRMPRFVLDRLSERMSEYMADKIQNIMPK